MRQAARRNRGHVPTHTIGSLYRSSYRLSDCENLRYRNQVNSSEHAMRSSYQSNYNNDIIPSHLPNDCVPGCNAREDGQESGDGKKPSDDAQKRAMVACRYPQWSIRSCQNRVGAHGVRNIIGQADLLPVRGRACVSDSACLR